MKTGSKVSTKMYRSKCEVYRQERHGIATGWSYPGFDWDLVGMVEIEDGPGWRERAIEKAVGHQEDLRSCPYWYLVRR